MANFTYSVPNDFLKNLDSKKIEQIVDKMLEAAAPILVDSMKSEIKSKVKNGSGAMERSIKSSKVKVFKNGGKHIDVFATGKDKKNMSNAEKLAYFNFGTSKQQARPIFTPALNKVENKIIKVMQEIYEKEVGT